MNKKNVLILVLFFSFIFMLWGCENSSITYLKYNEKNISRIEVKNRVDKRSYVLKKNFDIVLTPLSKIPFRKNDRPNISISDYQIEITFENGTHIKVEANRITTTLDNGTSNETPLQASLEEWNGLMNTLFNNDPTSTSPTSSIVPTPTSSEPTTSQTPFESLPSPTPTSSSTTQVQTMHILNFHTYEYYDGYEEKFMNWIETEVYQVIEGEVIAPFAGNLQSHEWYYKDDDGYWDVFDFYAPIYKDFELYTYANEPIIVTYYFMKGNSVYDAYSVRLVGEQTTAPESFVYELEGYEFIGWFYLDGSTYTEFDFDTIVTEDLKLYALYEEIIDQEDKSIRISLYYYYAKGDLASHTYGWYISGPSKISPPPIEEIEGYQAMGWFYIDGDEYVLFDFDTIVTEDLELYVLYV